MPRFAANLSLMFNELGFLERFGAARAAGFDGVEFLFPYAFDAEQIADADHLVGRVHDRGFAAVGLGVGDIGHRGGSCCRAPPRACPHRRQWA